MQFNGLKRYLKISLFLISLVLSSCNKETPLEPVVDEPNLLLYLPFEGNANDLSGNNNNATTINAALTTDRFNQANNAYYFNGIDDYILIPNSSSLSSISTSITISSWVYITDWFDVNWAPILVKSNSSNYGMYGLQLLNYSNRKQIEVHFQSTFLNQNYTFGTGNWYYIVFTWDGSTCKYYVNGSQVGSRQYSGSVSPDSLPLVIGADTPEVTEYLNGKIDDIRIYDKAISDSRIDSLYHLNGY